jgi:mycothiol synthase
MVTVAVAGAAQLVARLSPRDARSTFELLRAAQEADGVPPLSERAVLDLRHGAPRARHLLLHDAQRRVQAYAQVVDEGAAGPVTELAVHPAARSGGRGRALLNAALREHPGRPMRVWAHGDLPAAAALAAGAGLACSRVLLQLRRALRGPGAEPLPTPALPDGVTVRTFVPGADDAAWLALNARAFADHPEQGHWQHDDLRVRQAEPWFEPRGFFLAERDTERDAGAALVGAHWTKWPAGPAGTALGEVYVVGVDPSEQGRGLGPALTVIGLRWLRARGADTALLYVDGGNERARRSYARLGFTTWTTDVLYRRA